MGVREDVLHMVQHVWDRLQALPQANPLELGAFCVLVLFAATFVFLMILSCVHCCCCSRQKHQPTRVQPLHV